MEVKTINVQKQEVFVAFFVDKILSLFWEMLAVAGKMLLLEFHAYKSL